MWKRRHRHQPYRLFTNHRLHMVQHQSIDRSRHQQLQLQLQPMVRHQRRQTGHLHPPLPTAQYQFRHQLINHRLHIVTNIQYLRLNMGIHLILIRIISHQNQLLQRLITIMWSMITARSKHTHTSRYSQSDPSQNQGQKHIMPIVITKCVTSHKFSSIPYCGLSKLFLKNYY